MRLKEKLLKFPLQKEWSQHQINLERQTRHAMYLQRNNELRSRNRCCRGKAISITYSECVSVPSVVQHAKRMRLIILSAIEYPGLSYFSKLSHERHDLR
jgi:hypothetical protein